ncbi:MAG TPA: hypothetical protein VEQ85_05855 [Lacipirellulaceae bacterium]|nr:hypothetical protein [Lacipirellulaceae bacterium]
MSDDAERIRQQMQHVRRDMDAGMQDIKLGAKQLSDWRYYVRQHPWACVGSAFALGFLVTPARRKMLPGANVDMKALVEQLQAHGVSVGGKTTTASGGLAARLIAMAGPFLLRNASSILAQRLQAAGKQRAAQSSELPPHVGSP